MAKAHFKFLSFGFLLALVFPEISAFNVCIGRKSFPVAYDCLKSGCAATCKANNFIGLSRCIRTTDSGIVKKSTYECECCECEPKIAVDTNSCNNKQNCVFECILKANLYGPSECREGYDESGKFFHKCYCCPRKGDLTAGNIVAVA